eukprot:CAMPEP_0176063428 /NCGR_PEP_ID=MMETSP0120_2-20121206/31634_1 /TAXON_ID=160619 /ORGANISM="Kryptoperidinium foliaceum, Strain CCMP 1326" /LENGTH=310 /DNA_ID=CAMNT_0017397001 /DNA_START=52 /DNA_END=984 /DNA_ORIENTATION=-
MAPTALAAAVLLGGALATADVPSVDIGDGVQMPMLAFGTYRGSLRTCTVTEATKQWLDLGGRHVDTAFDYYTQPDVGAALKASSVPRQQLFITTKVPGPIGAQAVKDMIVNVSLPQLGLDYLDLVLIHFPCLEKKLFPNKCREKEAEERLDTWHGLVELKKAGKIRAIGVSNFDADQLATLAEASGVTPAVNQVEWHLGYHNETLLAAMKSRGVVLEAWGSLTGPTAANPGVALDDPRLKEIAQRYSAATPQVALRWSALKGVVPITATCSAAHVQSDIDAFAIQISADDLAALDSLAPPVIDSAGMFFA